MVRVTKSDQPQRNASEPVGSNAALNMAASHIASTSGSVKRRPSAKIFDDPAIVRGYDSVPIIEIDVLPRGGISFETEAVGRVQVSFFHLPISLCI